MRIVHGSTRVMIDVYYFNSRVGTSFPKNGEDGRREQKEEKVITFRLYAIENVALSTKGFNSCKGRIEQVPFVLVELLPAH